MAGLYDNPRRSGEPFHPGKVPMRRLLKAGLTLVLLAGFAGCGESEDTSAPAIPEATPVEADQEAETKDAPLPLETVKPDIRIIAGSEVPVLKPPAGQIERLPPATPPPQPRKPVRMEPDRFARPLVLSAGSFSSGGFTIKLAGVDAPAIDESCGESEDAWPCGKFARAALQRLVRARSIECEPVTGDDPGRWCKVGGHGLSNWLVSMGWARATDAKLDDLERGAREAGRGIWGVRP